MGWGKVASRSTKAAISLKRTNVDEKLLWRAHQRSFEGYHPYGLPFPNTEGSQPQPKPAITIISGMGKAIDCKFG